MCSCVEVNHPKPVNATDIGFLTIRGNDKGVESIVLFEEFFPCAFVAIEIE